MSLSATVAAAPHAPTETRKLLLLIWAVTVATYLLAGQGQTLSTDDAMRLVQVRDLLAGQAWFDVTQYRLNPPEGVAMHWSRLVDLPIALLIQAGEWIIAPALAERLALTVWPAGLLLVLLFGLARLARDLADDTAARLALMLAALMAPVLQHFRPGAIDHHNLQIVLVVWSIALLVRERPRRAAIAGVLCALSLAIGQETAPVIAAAAAIVAGRWVMYGEARRDFAAAFGMAFAAGSLVAFVATVPPTRYTVASCDALSIVQVLLAVSGGFGLAVLTAWPSLFTRLRRAAGVGELGGVAFAIVLAGFPGCLGDPYAQLDPRLASLWLANVSEARSIAGMVRDLPQEVLLYYVLPVIALALGLVRAWRDVEPQRFGWLLATVVLAAATLIAFWQVRGSAVANALALATISAALVRAMPASDDRGLFFGLGRGVLAVALLINPLSLIAAGNAAAWALERATGSPRPTMIADGAGTCRQPADYVPLASLPPGRVLGFIDAGPYVLMQTPHQVLAAPYHRNIAGNAAMFEIFLGHLGGTGARLAARGIDYVAFCPGAPERHNYAAAAPEGLAALLGRGEIPATLERIPLEGTDLQVYRVKR